MTSVGASGLLGLGFQADPEPEPPAVRLLAARALADNRVEVTATPRIEPDWALTDTGMRLPLRPETQDRFATVEPFRDERDGRLVWLVNAKDEPQSNRVVVDNPAALAAMLTSSTRPAAEDRPAELLDVENSPLVDALVRLHRTLIFDVSEVRGLGRSTNEATADEAEDTDEDFWHRVDQEHIGRDPRTANYLHTAMGGLFGSDPVIEALETLRAGLPTQSSPRSLLAMALDRPTASPEESGTHSTPQYAKASIRIRARNLLRRWADAQSDPRMVWTGPYAQGRHFVSIVKLLVDSRVDRVAAPEQMPLTEDDLDEIWLRWLRAIVGTGRRDGWIDQLDPNELPVAFPGQPREGLAAAVAALCWIALRPDRGRSSRERIIAAQPVLRAVLAHDLAVPDDETAKFLSVVTGYPIKASGIGEQLRDAANFIDDELWTQRHRDEFDLQRLRIENPPAHKSQPRLHVEGITDPLTDARLIRLIAAFRDYRRVARFAIIASEGWRLVIWDDGSVAHMSATRRITDADRRLTDEYLTALISSGGMLAELFPTLSARQDGGRTRVSPANLGS